MFKVLQYFFCIRMQAYYFIRRVLLSFLNQMIKRKKKDDEQKKKKIVILNDFVDVRRFGFVMNLLFVSQFFLVENQFSLLHLIYWTQSHVKVIRWVVLPKTWYILYFLKKKTVPSKNFIFPVTYVSCIQIIFVSKKGTFSNYKKRNTYFSLKNSMLPAAYIYSTRISPEQRRDMLRPGKRKGGIYLPQKIYVKVLQEAGKKDKKTGRVKRRKKWKEATASIPPVQVSTVIKKGKRKGGIMLTC